MSVLHNEAQAFRNQYSKTIKTSKMKQSVLLASMLSLGILMQCACENSGTTKETEIALTEKPVADTPEYFLLRPKLEKEYGYSHAVRIGDDLKISGAVSMDDNGVLVGEGSMEQQMKNCYSDLEKILKHYGYTFDDVVVENVYTTNMEEFIKVSGYRASIYKKQFPTGTWLEVKGLAVQGQLIEIDMEAHKSK
jgi:enamine deaminase RidA (YjgF/YER057c/UK114 family)